MTVKRERNSEKTKKAILEAAEEQFSTKGFYGARIDEIAEQAQINKRMIYEYYTNKEELYKKVLFIVYKRMELAETQLQACAYTGVELIRSIIAMYFDFLYSNPNFVSILMWENLNKAKYLNELPADHIKRPTIRFFTDEIKRGIESGIYKTGIDENQVVISLITVCFANFSNGHTLSKLFGMDLCSREMMEIRKQQTIDIMLAYLCKQQ